MLWDQAIGKPLLKKGNILIDAVILGKILP